MKSTPVITSFLTLTKHFHLFFSGVAVMVVRKVELNHQLGENYICFCQIGFHSFGPSLHHGLDLESVYQHILPGSAGPEVTTLHSQVGATVDYIFYNPRRNSRSDAKGRRTKPNSVWTDFILRNLFFFF